MMNNRKQNKFKISSLVTLVSSIFVLSVMMLFVGKPTLASAAACTPPTTNYGNVTQSLTVPSSGIYRVWSRLAAPDSTNNTYLLEIDNGNNSSCYTVGGSVIPVYGMTTNTHFNSDATNWTSIDPTTGNHIDVSLSAGTTYTIKEIGNGPNVVVDRIIFTADTTCIPTGNGDNCGNPTPPPSCTGSPSMPEILPRTTITSSSIEFFWNASVPAPNCTIKNYLIFRGGKYLGNSTTTSYRDWGLQPSTSYTYTVQAQDTTGNKSAQTAPFTLKTSPSIVDSVVINNPQTGDVVTGDVHINVKLSGKIDHINYVIDRIFFQQEPASTPNVIWRTTRSDNGQHLIVANAFDSAGNKVSTSQITITVSNGFCLSTYISFGTYICF